MPRFLNEIKENEMEVPHSSNGTIKNEVYLSQDAFDSLVENDELEPNTIYHIEGYDTDKAAKKALLDFFYPIGSYYETSDSTFDPNITWGGKWVQDTIGYTTVAANTLNLSNVYEPRVYLSIGEITGEVTHTLTISEMPSHSHMQFVGANSGSWGVRTDYNSDGNCSSYNQGNTGTTGGSGAHNNVQPSIGVIRWHRIPEDGHTTNECKFAVLAYAGYSASDTSVYVSVDGTITDGYIMAIRRSSDTASLDFYEVNKYTLVVTKSY